MNKELKKKWLKALRSGKFEQGRRVLKFEDKNGKDRYCCLGVLCETLKESDKDLIEKKDNIQEKYYFGYKTGNSDGPGDLSCAWLPESICNKVNLNPAQIPALVGLNDLDHKNFSEIADWIEKNIPDDVEVKS